MGASDHPFSCDRVLTESRETGDLFRALFPHLEILDWPTEAARWAGAELPDPEDRHQKFSAWLEQEVPGEAERFLFTIERLRESLITTHEHVEYCFSVLPPTPRHQKLEKLFHQYLDSELALDWTGQAWLAIENFKEGKASLENEMVFWHDEEPTFLFQEFVGAVAKGTPIDRTESSGGMAPVWIDGLVTDLLDRLADRAAHLIQKNVAPEKIVVPFAGEPQNFLYLKLALKRRNIPFSLVGFPETSGLTRFSEAAKLRKDPSLSLKERLLKSRRSWKSKRPDEAIGKGPQQTDGGVLICPFQALPSLPNHHQLAFVDGSYLFPKRYPFCLEEDEVDRLHVEGFSLPRHSDLRARRWRTLQRWNQKDGQRMLFCESPSAKAIRKKWHSLAPKKDDSKPEQPTENVPLPEKPFSATQLETYVRCPSQYLFSNRLKLEADRTEWDRRYPLIFGNAVHTALENHVKESGDADDLETLENRFSKALVEIAPELKPEHPYARIAMEQFRKVLPNFQTLEKSMREVFGKSKPLALEKDFLLDIDDLAVRGKIDRVDEGEDGTLLVFDYKTGNVTFSPNHIQSGTHFQALLYLLAAEKEFPDKTTRGFLFYDLKKGELKRGILREGLISADAKKSVTRGHAINEEKYLALIQKGSANVKDIGQKIRSGDFTPVPETNICLFCDHAALCRKGAGYA